MVICINNFVSLCITIIEVKQSFMLSVVGSEDNTTMINSNKQQKEPKFILSIASHLSNQHICNYLQKLHFFLICYLFRLLEITKHVYCCHIYAGKWELTKTSLAMIIGIRAPVCTTCHRNDNDNTKTNTCELHRDVSSFRMIFHFQFRFLQWTERRYQSTANFLIGSLFGVHLKR